jgi:RNA polymerase sigma-70 factor (ECF subfamily)
MTRAQATQNPFDVDDQAAFSQHAERHRHELQVHCYRMLGSFDEAEDMVQETFLRAWRRRETFQARSTFRAWLYRIATNACLDALERRPRRPSGGEVSWLQPYPDNLLDEIAADEEEPDAALVAKETIELAYLVAIQHLPPRSRAVLILRDVLGWSAKDTADLIDTSVAAANSALQRARTALKDHLPERRLEWTPGTDPSQEERELVQRYVEATERADANAFLEIMSEDSRFSMPPEPGTWVGRRTIVDGWVEGGFGQGKFADIRTLVTRVNRQFAVANYVKQPGSAKHTFFALDVLRVEEGAVTEITAFHGSGVPDLGLPPAL